MRKAFLMVIAALGVIGGLLASQQGNAQTVDQGFDSDFVVVMSKSDRRPATVLMRPTYKIKCRNGFLVGECVEESGSWRNGKTVWIAIDQIAEIIEVKRADEFQGPEPAVAPEPPVPAPPPRKQKTKRP